MRSLILILFITFSPLMGLNAQDVGQTIRGQVLDQQSQIPLPGVNVVVVGAQPAKGAATDIDGYFTIEDVPIGRITVAFTYLGYEPAFAQNIELTGSKELVLNITLREKTQEIEEVVISGEANKERALNERANVSARTFSIEESMRFAGSNQDISRMAANFAGVQRSNDATNDIVIRGNSPFGLIWRLEGVDIPNPNHFGGLGASGGPVSMLNNNVLSNSDFITSSFPSEYGNGISGVFDLRMRNGNYEKHEFLGQIGFNGLEFGAEGPINREKKSSYMFNYRYSTLGILAAIGVDFGTGTAIPKYQDINMKLHFPSRTFGTVDVFALGGISSIEFLDSESEDEDNFYSDDEDLRNRVNNGVIGISHQYMFDKSLYSKVTVAWSGIGNFTEVDTISADGNTITPTYRQNFRQSDLQLSAFINKKFNVHHVLRAGAYITNMQFNLLDSSFFFSDLGFRTLRDHDASDMLYQPYLNWQYRITDNWEMNTGLHAMFLQSNSNASIEPRFGITYRLDDKQSLNFGYGLHSQTPHVTTLYRQVTLDDGSIYRPNENLDFIKSHHLVLGYDRMFANRVHFKAETYYQSIFDAVVEQNPSSFSNLNFGSFSFDNPDSAQTGGVGYNYGLDLTLEKFMDRGFYFLTTLSVFESKYQGSDKVWRNTAFNGNFVYNLVGGKEFVLGRKKKDAKLRHTLTIDGKLTWAGGQRYTPIDLQESIAEGDEVYDENRAYEEQFSDYFRADIRIGYKQSGKRFTQEWALDIQNFTNHKNPFGQNFNAETQEAETTFQLGLFPMLLYRITF